MSVIQGNARGGGGYQIPRSLRLRSSASAYLSRMFGTPTNNLKWTWSAWVKRGTLGGTQCVFHGNGDNTTNRETMIMLDGDSFRFYNQYNAVNQGNIVSTAVLRDPSAWYHLMIVYDSAQATAANRVLFYVNGVQLTSFGTNSIPPQNQATYINANGNSCYYGFRVPQNDLKFDGYLSEVNFIDGQALTPSSFGETSATTGQWQAKRYTGTYGTNGFYLPFSDTTSTTTLCYDASGNGNNWTPTNISLTAGVTYDSMTDVPLGGGGSLGNGQGNYCVLNPLAASGTLSNGNLNAVVTAGGGNTVDSTIAVLSGKYYCECTYTGGSAQAIQIGVARGADFKVSGSSGVAYYSVTGQKVIDGTVTAYGATFTYGDVIGIALDADGGTVTFYKNNVSQGAITLPTSTSGWKFVFGNNTGAGTQTLDLTFGQRPFAYTPPTGFKALHTGNLSAPAIAKPNQHFDVLLHTGNSTNRSLTGLQFQPDLAWIKARNTAYYNVLTDSVRGVNSQLFSNDTLAQETRTDRVTAFNADGISLGTYQDVNLSTYTYVDWLWKAGGAAVTNNSGSISAQVSANPTAGFSIATYTGTGANATVGHGLGVAPKMVIVKSRNTAGTAWPVYHASLANTQTLTLHSTSAVQTVALWGNTTPTSAVFTVSDASGTNGDTNFSGRTYVAYCFAEIAGYSKFGSYTGNGSADGPFVYCGFRPRYVMVKRTDVADDWYIKDAGRDTYNVMGNTLLANSSAAEFTGGNTPIDFTSNGFKIRTTSAGVNSGTLVYAAFAESPFQSALAR